MFDQQEAAEFLNHLFDEIWQQGHADKLEDFYWSDVLGHYPHSTFNFSDIRSRVCAFDRHYKKRKFEVQHFFIINDLLVLTLTRNFLDPIDNDLSVSPVPLVYRIKEKKISEVWILECKGLPSYSQVNQEVTKIFNQFKLSRRDKDAFFHHLEARENLQEKSVVSLTRCEKECLFYYLNGYTAKEIARELSVSHRTVETHIVNIKQKSDCSTRGELRKVFYIQGE